MQFGVPSASFAFSTSRDASGYGLSTLGGVASSAVLSTAAAVAEVPEPVACMSTCATLRGSFVACCGASSVSAVTVTRSANATARDAAGRGQGSFAPPSLQLAPRINVSPAAKSPLLLPSTPTALAVCPLRGGAPGRSSAQFDRAVIITGCATGHVQVHEVMSGSQDTNVAPELAQAVPVFALAGDGLCPPHEASIAAIAGASSYSLGVSWVAVATRTVLRVYDANSLAGSAAEQGTPAPIATLDASTDAFFTPSFSGASIVSVSSVLESLSSDAASSAADSEDDAAAAPTNMSAGASMHNRTALPDGTVADVPAFSVTWSDGVVHTIRAALAPVERTRQPVSLYASRAFDFSAVVDGAAASVCAASTSALPARSAHGARQQPAPLLRSVAVDASGTCFVVVYDAENTEEFDAADFDDASAHVLRVGGATVSGVGAVDTEEGAGRALSTVVVAFTGNDMFASRWERAAGEPNGVMRPFRGICSFAEDIAAVATLPALAVSHTTHDRTTPSTPASRSSLGTGSAARPNLGPVAIAAVDRSLHFVLM